MYLEKLEIQGFKSFAPKTTINLDGGITAIVGPNGSGKSNVADAIRWVMGEQSIKNLRGKKSEDIIFAGSNIKGKMGMAEVSLFLNNEDSAVPIDYSELVLTRRLYRSGESEYLLNKSKVRLMDIHELLAKAGFGQKTYSVIGQGMIDAILRAGPKERREMFEEAAGIKHFQLKRNSSINKLERTKQNLLRVGDLLSEIGPRRNSLKRQANKAQKKDQIKDELKTLQSEYFNHLWNKNKEELGNLKDELAELDHQEKAIEKEIAAIKLKLNQAEEDIDYSREDQLRQNLNKLTDKKNSIREKLAMIQGKIEAASQQDYSVGVESFNQSKTSLEEGIKSSQNLLDSLQAEKASLQQGIDSHSNQIGRINQEQAGLEEKINNLRNQVSYSGSESLKKDVDHLNRLQSDLFEQLDACQNLEKFEEFKARVQGMQADFQTIIKRINQHTAGSSYDQNEINEIQSQIQKIISERVSLEQQASDKKIKLAVIDTKIETQTEVLNKHQQDLEMVESRIQSMAEAGGGDNSALKQLLLDKEVWQKKFDAIQTEVEDASKQIDNERQQERSARKQIFAMEKDYRELQEKLNGVRNYINQTQIKIARVENERSLLLDEITDNTTEAEYQQLKQEFESSPINIAEVREQELKQKIEKLRKQLLAIGEIDPEVVVEYEECEQRFTYLDGQKEDLENAMESLKKIISELDDTISQKFDVAFKNINEQFQKYFEVLFGGGRAKLMKKKVKIKDTDESGEDLEEGNGESKNIKEEEQIEIVATPPGKKLKNLSMLSGGERALTSIALLFAIITNNPAPFMVLDEVDAALDESNSSRYADIVTSLADKSQFIIITHNRETMRRAKLLYGVTMEQSGISKLLSVKLENLPN